MESSNSITSSSIVIQGKTPRKTQIENPFTLKVGQVFTGFGIGCGIGIGVGRPLNLGAIPVLNQVMSATGGATHAFSGVARHVNDSLRKLGAKNIEAGIGCGVGFGHGFGVGLAVKPRVLHQVQSCLMEAVTKMMIKFGIAPNISLGQGTLPASLQSGMNMLNQPSNQNPMNMLNQPSNQNPMNMLNQPFNQNPMGSIMQLGTAVPSPTFQGQPSDGDLNIGSSNATKGLDTAFGTRTEKVLSGFLQNPVLKEEGTELNDLAVRLRSENNMLQMVLKHQQVIEELMEENEKLRQVLMEDLKIPASKLEASHSSKSKSPCTDCFDCRRKQRKH